MSFVTADEDKRRAEKAARYLIEQHGDDATTEAEAALRNAIKLNDKLAIEALTDILAILEGTRST